MVAAIAACTRPVLYYPAPDPVTPAPAPQPVFAGAPVSPAPAAPENTSSLNDFDYVRARHLVVPVAGANMAKVTDTFLDARDGGDRTHRAIDILAPRGTPILAADDGKILRMSSNTLGGITMYTVDPSNRIVYYYAHMDHYNDAMSPGRAIARGDTLGFVGTTGNAPKDTPHLHFQIMRWPADGKYWNGEPIDPFELLGGVRRSTESIASGMALTSKERAALRGEAHHLSASVHVGQHGISDSLKASLDDALRTHELVKIQFGKNTDVAAKDAANGLAEAMGADVVQVIGKTVTLYRENPDLKRKKGVPPWRAD